MEIEKLSPEACLFCIHGQGQNFWRFATRWPCVRGHMVGCLLIQRGTGNYKFVYSGTIILENQPELNFWKTPVHLGKSWPYRIEPRLE